jgi:hypothetical protein
MGPLGGSALETPSCSKTSRDKMGALEELDDPGALQPAT